MQRIKLDVTKLNKEMLFKGAKGTYADLTLMDNRDGTDQYGNDGFVVQDVGKERREAGEKGPIVGNWKYVGERKDLGRKSSEYGQREQPPQGRSSEQGGAQPPQRDEDDDGMDSIPF